MRNWNRRLEGPVWADGGRLVPRDFFATPRNPEGGFRKKPEKNATLHPGMGIMIRPDR